MSLTSPGSPEFLFILRSHCKRQARAWDPITILSLENITVPSFPNFAHLHWHVRWLCFKWQSFYQSQYMILQLAKNVLRSCKDNLYPFKLLRFARRYARALIFSSTPQSKAIDAETAFFHIEMNPNLLSCFLKERPSRAVCCP